MQIWSSPAQISWQSRAHWHTPEAPRDAGRHVIVVSNKVGLGLVPPYPLGRVYRDLLGRANQILARHANAVYFLAAGIPMRLKGKEEGTI